MDLEVAELVQGVVALGPAEAATELIEDGGGESDLGGGVEVHDSLEGAGSALGGLLLLLQDQLIERGHDVLEASNQDLLLGDTGVCGLLLLVDALGEVEAGAEGAADKVDDVAGNGGREHEVLALDLFRIGEVGPDLVDLLGEAVVEQTVSLVHDESVEVGCLDARVGIGEDVEETAGGSNEDVATLALGLLQHHTLLCAANSSLDDQASVLGDLLGLDGDLLGELTGGRDDDGPDIVCFGALVATGLLAELGVARDDALNDGNEETKCLAGTGLCLCDAVID